MAARISVGHTVHPAFSICSLRNRTIGSLRADWTPATHFSHDMALGVTGGREAGGASAIGVFGGTLPPSPAAAAIVLYLCWQLQFYAAFLTATGRVLYDVFVYPNHNASGASAEEPGYLIEVDTEHAQTLAKHIKRYKLRAKLTVRLLGQDEATVWHAWDDSNTVDWNSIVKSANVALQDPRAPGLGYRVLQLDQKAPQIDIEQSTEDAYTIRRYLNGIPEGQDEISREHALPQETNMDIMNGIDYHKGCYVGQELTIRTRHRGVVRKRILPCVVYEKEHAPPTALQYHADGAASSLESVTADMIPRDTSIGRFEKRGRSAGKWLKGVGNIGLGLCRLEIMTDITLPGDAASGAFNPEDEFVLDWGEEETRNRVKVRAFVPDWLRKGLDAENRR